MPSTGPDGAWWSRAGPRVVTDPAEHERLLRTGPESWMPMRDGVFVRIEAGMVSGRELAGARVHGTA
ncbi:hypothetical protein SHIRM173S_12837 [Streptomyces hirsutus]